MKATRDENPARLYLASLSEGSQCSMRHALETIAKFLSDGEDGAETFAWEEVRYRDTAAVRAELKQRYMPATVNKILSALRGVLKQTWRLGLVDADTYKRAVDIGNVKSESLLRGRALESDEVVKLFEACAVSDCTAGRRDAAMMAVFYGCGVRRAELAGLDLSDFDADDCSLTVRKGKGQKQRTVYLVKEGCEYVKSWIDARGEEPGPLFCPVSHGGWVRLSRLRGESIAYILRRRQETAGLASFSPHDLRRSFVTGLLDSGEDVFVVQRMAGHADVGTTVRYDRRGEVAKRRAAQSLRIPGLGGGESSVSHEDPPQGEQSPFLEGKGAGGEFAFLAGEDPSFGGEMSRNSSEFFDFTG